MCRWLAYSGGSIPLEELLFKPEHNLIDQSMSSRSKDTPTNGDGFGVGWYGDREQPGLFRSIQPAWNDTNLRDLAAHIESPLFMAHVRATSLATVQQTNCHPFRYRDWLFVHNGEIEEVQKLRRELLMAIDPAIFENILGSTDSEIMFHLAITFGLESDPQGALQRMVDFVEKTARSHGIKEAIWMTLGVSDGTSLYAVRYASGRDAPTLYRSPSIQEFRRINPAMADRVGDSAIAVVSETQGRLAKKWPEIPAGSFLHAHGGEIEVKPFKPQA
jgi:predicted glutamine amidotransferase